MTIKHSVDLVVKFIDSFTDKPLIEAHEAFHLNGISIKPAKRIAPFVVFSNLIMNPKYHSCKGESAFYELAWTHPYYEPVTFEFTPRESRRDDAHLIRAIPSQQYPFLTEITAIRGVATGSQLVEVIHRHSKNRLILKSSVIANKYVDISQSFDTDLCGRKFLFTEEYHDQIVTLRADDIGIYSEPDFSFPYSEACEIYEIIEAIPDSNGRFMLLLKTVKQTEQELMTFKLMIHVNAREKSTLVKIKRDVVNDVGILGG